MTQQPPAWKFWHPMRWWHVLLVFVVANLVATFAVVALREGLGVPVPTWITGGIGGLLGWFAVVALVRRRRSAEAPRDDRS